jgi:hypothetical protein
MDRGEVKKSIIESLSEIGMIEVCSINDFVFTLFIKGDGLTSYKKCTKIQDTLSEFLDNDYPLIQVMVNDEDFYLCVMSKI